jgi:hypothetical protein
MLSYRIPPTRTDIEIANAVSEYTNSGAERAAELLTWGADEHVLLAVAAGWWLYCRRGSVTQRKNSDHLLLTTLAASLIPHLLKNIFDQRRPDRLTVRGISAAFRSRASPSMLSRPAMPCMSARWRPPQPCCHALSAISSGHWAPASR